MVGAGVTSGCGKGGCVPGMLEITRSYAASIAFACLVSMLGANESRGSEPRTPGPQPDGSVVLPNQWSLRPVGRQVDVGDFPAAIAVHPSGSHAVVLHCGYGPHELVVLDVQSRRVVSRVAIDESFHGVAFNPAGSMVYASGGGGETILPFRFESGVLVPLTPIRLRDEKERGVPAGIALTSDGRTLVVANVWGHSVTRVRLDASPPTVEHLPLTQAAVPAPAIPAATTDDPSITKRADQLLERTVADLPYPFACVVDEHRGRVYVSLWAQAAVAVIDLAEWKVVGRFEVEEHPNEMLLAADGSRLFVANANINSVAVFDISRRGGARSLGFIPCGWYPTSVRLAG
ncbi:MAG: YncE family protein, partial [Planctomycetaceae bacterium]